MTLTWLPYCNRRHTEVLTLLDDPRLGHDSEQDEDVIHSQHLLDHHQHSDPGFQASAQIRAPELAGYLMWHHCFLAVTCTAD